MSDQITEVGEYKLINPDKVNRAINGTITRGGALIGGVGEDATDEAILAEYDRLGGLITKNGLKVKTGSFWNFAKKQAHKEPQVSFMTNLEGENIEVNEEEAESIQQAKQKIVALKNKKAQKVAEDSGEEPKKKRKAKKEDVE